MSKDSKGQVFAFVGSYKDGDGAGIYAYRVDLATGKLDLAGRAPGIQPLYVAVHPAKDAIYGVHGEVKGREVNIAGSRDGAVSAYALNGSTGEMTYLNSQPSKGVSPCYVSVDATGKSALVANYDSGSITALPIGADRRLGAPSDFVQHTGSSIDPKRQTHAYAHAMDLDPSNRFAIAADLGIDKLMVYALDAGAGKLKPAGKPWAQTRAGSGPRHFAFHPKGKYMYVISELNSSMTAYEFNSSDGGLKEIQTIATVPAGSAGANYCADVRVEPSGRFVYGSNRGHDSIVIYAIDQETGKLSLIGFQPSGGKTPRAFAIDPTGKYLLSANLASDNVTTFRIGQATGKLEPTGHVVSVPSPGCITAAAL